MDLDIPGLKAFVAVAERGSFHAAAESLHLSAPALSRRVEKLEKMLGVRLFDRTTRSVTLTSVGRDFSHKARFLLDELESSLLGIRELAAHRVGEVTIACIPSAVTCFLTTALQRFRGQFPNIRVRIIEETSGRILSGVLRGEFEFGINLAGGTEPEIEFRQVLREPYVLVCRRDHPLAASRKLSWAELSGCELITVSKENYNRHVIDAALVKLHARAPWFYEVRLMSSLPGLVEAGLGIAVIPRLALAASGHTMLASIPLVDPTVTRTLGLISRRGRSLAPAAQQLYAMIAAMRTARLG